MSNNDDLPRRAYSPAEVGIMLGLSAAQVRGLIRNEKLKARTTGKTYRISATELEKFLNGADDPMQSAS